MKDMSVEEFLMKATYEGSLHDGFSWGLKPSDLNDSTPKDFLDFVKKAYDAWRLSSLCEQQFDLWCEEYEVEES